MATTPFQTRMTVSGNQFRMQRISEAAAQTFLTGTPLQLTAGFLAAWNGTTTTDGIAGVSAEFGANLAVAGVPQQQTFGTVPFQPAAGNFSRPYFNDGKTGVYVATADTVFFGQVGPTQTTAQSDIGVNYGMTIDTDGHWFIDKTKTGAAAVVQITGLDDFDTTRGVRFVFLVTAAQLLA
jgi:hypothetical protein